MADKLKISDEVFNHLTQAMTAAHHDLNATGEVSDNVADAVGHKGLADELHTFANNWRITRGKLVKSMDALNSQMKSVVETFKSTDKSIADSMGGGDAQPQQQVAPGSGSGGGSGAGSAGGSGGGAAGGSGSSSGAAPAPMPAMPTPPPSGGGDAPVQAPEDRMVEGIASTMPVPIEGDELPVSDIGDHDVLPEDGAPEEPIDATDPGTDSGTEDQDGADGGPGTGDLIAGGAIVGGGIVGGVVAGGAGGTGGAAGGAGGAGGAAGTSTGGTTAGGSTPPSAPDAEAPAAELPEEAADAAMPAMPDEPSLTPGDLPVVDPQAGTEGAGAASAAVPDGDGSVEGAGSPMDGSAEDHEAPQGAAAAAPLASTAAMGGMAAMHAGGSMAGAGGAAAGGAASGSASSATRADGSAPQSRSDEQRAREARELLKELNDRRKAGENA